jgi:hypothetical protein
MLVARIPVVPLLASLSASAAAQHNSGDLAVRTLNGMTGSNPQPSPTNYPGMSLDKFLEKYPTLADEIKTLTGATAANACEGFKNVGECMTAIYAAQNLSIGFDCLRAGVFGSADPNTNCATASSKHLGLEKALKTLKPSADSKVEIERARKQAKQELLYYAYGWK